MNGNITLRIATPDDASALLAIYAHYVQHTAITYEYDVPTLADFRARIAHTLEMYPYIAAERNGELIGYAYTSAFHARAAYKWSAETSIYTRLDCHGLGLGRRLYDVIERISRAQNIVNLNACIAYPETEDEYLTKNSVQFHEHIGFSYVGEFHNCAYKFGRWYNMVWMEKSIAEHISTPAPVVPFPEMDKAVLAEILQIQ